MEATSPSGISRPFDARRDGFVMGEGAGVLVLEEKEAAEARGAEILGELLGYGATCDAFHLTAPQPEGPRRRGRSAWRSPTPALSAADVDYVNAHGTSTPLNDRCRDEGAEGGAGRARRRHPGQLDQVGDRPPARRRRRGRGDRHGRGAAPPRGAADGRLGRGRGGARPRLRARVTSKPIENGDGPLVAISNSFGFGGHNAVLCLAAVMATATATPHRRASRPPTRRCAQLEQLCDPGSFRPLRSGVSLGPARRARDPRRRRRRRRRRGRAAGRSSATPRTRPSSAAASARSTPTRSCALLRMAGDAGAPVVGFVRSGGARLQEGHAALAGYGRIFRASVELSPQGAADLDRSAASPPAAAPTRRR